MSSVSCLTGTSRLQDCFFNRNTDFCDESNVIGITCSNCTMYLCDDGECADATHCDGNMECVDGSDEDKATCGQSP